MTFKVFQVMLGDERIDELDAKGWGGTAWDKTYTKLTMFPKESAVEELVADALKFGLLVHTMTVDVSVLDACFEATNGFGNAEVTVHAPNKSGSVGDVFVNVETGEASVVMPFGFATLDAFVPTEA